MSVAGKAAGRRTCAPHHEANGTRMSPYAARPGQQTRAGAERVPTRQITGGFWLDAKLASLLASVHFLLQRLGVLEGANALTCRGCALPFPSVLWSRVPQGPGTHHTRQPST